MKRVAMDPPAATAAALLVALVLWLGPSLLLCRAETLSEIYGDELLGKEVYFKSGPFGSMNGGDWFTDFWQSLDGKDYNPQHWPDGMTVRHGERIDSIQMLYGPYHGAHHGGEGGVIERARLYEGDRIVRVTGRRGIGPGAGIDGLTFHTKNGHVLGPFGGDGGFAFEASPPPNVPDCYLAWISGRAYLRLDAIAFHWRCPAPRQDRRPRPEEVFQDYDDVSGSGRPSTAANLCLQVLLTLASSWLGRRREAAD